MLSRARESILLEILSAYANCLDWVYAEDSGGNQFCQPLMIIR